jgi:hypothetical protein
VALPGGLLHQHIRHRDDRVDPGPAHTTGRLRIQIGTAVGDAARSVAEVAAAHRVSRPDGTPAFIEHAEALLTEPVPVPLLGIDETRRGKLRWEYRKNIGRWVRVDPWDTGFVDLDGDQSLRTRLRREVSEGGREDHRRHGCAARNSTSTQPNIGRIYAPRTRSNLLS